MVNRALEKLLCLAPVNDMKKIYILFFALFAAVSLSSAKNDKDVAYLFGVSFSHSDSIVYFTEIQPLEGVKLQSRSRILPDRQHYAYELKDYMNFTEGKPGRTSAIYFAKSRKKLEKVEAKIKKKVLHKDKGTVRYLGDKFRFTLPSQ